jgi:hypothetical protein
MVLFPGIGGMFNAEKFVVSNLALPIGRVGRLELTSAVRRRFIRFLKYRYLFLDLFAILGMEFGQDALELAQGAVLLASRLERFRHLPGKFRLGRFGRAAILPPVFISKKGCPDLGPAPSMDRSHKDNNRIMQLKV